MAESNDVVVCNWRISVSTLGDDDGQKRDNSNENRVVC